MNPMMLASLFSSIPGLLGFLHQDPRAQLYKQLQSQLGKLFDPSNVTNTAGVLYRGMQPGLASAFNNAGAAGNILTQKMNEQFSGPVSSGIGSLAKAAGGSYTQSQLGDIKSRAYQDAFGGAQNLIGQQANSLLGAAQFGGQPQNGGWAGLQGGWESFAPFLFSSLFGKK